MFRQRTLAYAINGMVDQRKADREVSTTLMQRSGHAEFIRLNAIILKACQPDLKQRYADTSEMLRELQEASKAGQPAG